MESVLYASQNKTKYSLISSWTLAWIGMKVYASDKN